MIKTLKKLIISLMVIVLISNFIFLTPSFAADDPFVSGLEEVLGTVVGFLTYPVRIIASWAAIAVDKLLEMIAYSQGEIDATGKIIKHTSTGEMITPLDILFNKIAILDVNFFNILNDGTIISNIRNSVANWYYAMRTIAASILLCVFIYVGIRMAISTVASDKAAYKKMLVDWVCSLALIFLLQYIIIFTFAVNEAFIHGLSNISDGSDLKQAMIAIKTEAMTFKGSSINSIAATVVFCMLVAQTLGMFISYFNRMLKVAFLIIIAPLITLTYSIDKMGDGKAQALGTWLKEFVYTVLLQTFHCVIYMAFISMAMNIFNSSGSDNNLIGAIFTMLCIKFTKDAEKILGKIFKFGDATSDTSLAVGMAASAMALSKAKGIGKGTRNAVNGLKNLKGSASNLVKNAKVDFHTAKNVLTGGMSIGAAKEAATATVLAASAAKMEKAKFFNINAADQSEANDYAAANKAGEDAANQEKDPSKKEEARKKAIENYTKNWDDKKKARYDYNQQVENEKKANIAQGMSAGLAAAQARATVAQRARDARKSERTPRVIKGAKGVYNKAKSIARSSETLKVFGDMAKSTMAAGLGLAAGSMTYGASGNAFNSIAAGTATYRGTKEFMQNSAKTLTNDTAQLFQAAGDKTATDAALHASNIRANSDIYEDGAKLKEEINNAFNEIKNQLDSILGKEEASSFKSKITNIMESDIKSNPGLTNEQLISRAMNHSSVADEVKALGDNKCDLTNSLGKAANLKRDKVIYDNMKSAGDIGLSTDTMINESIKTFESYMAADRGTTTTDTTLEVDIKNGNIADAKGALEQMEHMSYDDIVENKRMLDESEVQLSPDVEAAIGSEILEQERVQLKGELETCLREIERGNENARGELEGILAKIETKQKEVENMLAKYEDNTRINTQDYMTRLKKYEEFDIESIKKVNNADK